MKIEDITNPSIPIPGEVTKWGYRNLSESQYREFPAINASLLKCPTLAEMYALLTGPQKQTPALALGTLADMAILTPEEPWAERFVLADIPINTTTGKAYGADSARALLAVEAAQTANPGKFVVSADALKEMTEELDSLVKAFYASALCQASLAGALKQVSGIMWHPIWQCWVKWKPDVLPRVPDAKLGWGIADLKTTRHHVLQFERDCAEFGYFDQAGWYATCHEALVASQGLQIRVTHFDFLVVSKADVSGRRPRPAMARKIRVPLDPEINQHMAGFHRRIFPKDGFGRVELFLAGLREHIAKNPDPEDKAEIARIWTAYQNESEPFILCKLPYKN